MARVAIITGGAQGIGAAVAKQFLIDGSETPKTIPSWIWAGLIIFFGWALYYILTS